MTMLAMLLRTVPMVSARAAARSGVFACEAWSDRGVILRIVRFAAVAPSSLRPATNDPMIRRAIRLTTHATTSISTIRSGRATRKSAARASEMFSPVQSYDAATHQGGVLQVGDAAVLRRGGGVDLQEGGHVPAPYRDFAPVPTDR